MTYLNESTDTIRDAILGLIVLSQHSVTQVVHLTDNTAILEDHRADRFQ
jgi:hypothetical protein